LTVEKVAIIGSGIVGICAAIELLKTGHDVTLFDKSEPGMETSQWNAGVLATSSLYPLNNPQIFGNIPRLLMGKTPGFHYNLSSSFQTLKWGLKFLNNARPSQFEPIVEALHNIISLSRNGHDEYLKEMGKSDLLKRDGWLMLYENESAYRAGSNRRHVFDKYDVEYEVLSPSELSELEPALKKTFYRAVHIKDSASADPRTIVKTYIEHAKKLGAHFKKHKVLGISPSTNANGVQIHAHTGETTHFDKVVVSAGAWSNKLLKDCGIQLPMIVERGYIQRFKLDENKQINRPICDISGGLVLSPRSGSVQISTGTDLTTLNQRVNRKPMTDAINRVRSILDLGEPDMPTPAVGNRPSLPDGLPVIGALKNLPNVWLACGHQHIGFNTSTGTAKLLSSLINDSESPIDPTPFSPARFRL
jgi:D-amino-acid dehydrogenase